MICVVKWLLAFVFKQLIFRLVYFAEGMGTAAPAGESGCGAAGQERPKQAPCPTWRNTTFAGGTKVDSPCVSVGRPPKRYKTGKIMIYFKDISL